MAALDTLAFVRRLEKAGVPREQAEAHAEALAALAADELATRQDIQQLRAEIRELELRLTARIDQVEAKLNARIDQVESGLNARIDQLEQRMTIKLGGMIAVAIAITATLVKLL